MIKPRVVEHEWPGCIPPNPPEEVVNGSGPHGLSDVNQSAKIVLVMQFSVKWGDNNGYASSTYVSIESAVIY